MPGYITEKILDCFTSGIVPIYAGAPNVKQYIPENTFIDYFQFETLEELDDFFKKGLQRRNIKNYLQAADEFLKIVRNRNLYGKEICRMHI